MKPICPQPGDWHRVYEHLRAVARRREIRSSPPIPLILAGWAGSNDLEKKARWDDTLEWAERNGLRSEIQLTSDQMYCVTEPYGGLVDPYGTPMYLHWRREPSPVPNAEELSRALGLLVDRWPALPPAEVTRITKPLRFTGRKRRRLLVAVITNHPRPPWGTWESLSYDPSRRRCFTELRREVNQVVAPHHVDHIAFLRWAQRDGGCND